MYNKKIMELFKKPKYAGRLKNADGVGEVINPQCGDSMRVFIKVKDDKIIDIKVETLGCLPPTEEVSLGNRWTPISSLSTGKMILNGKGERTKIKQFYEAPFNGKLVLITPFVSRFNSFYVTPTHPVLCIKRKYLKNTRRANKKCDWLRTNEKEIISTEPYFLEAELLEKGDYLIFPKRKQTIDNPEFSKDVMRLMGYYLSEGYVLQGSVINFAFNKNEIEYIKEVKLLSQKIIGKEGSERTRKNVTELCICSTKFAKFLLKHCGKYAKQKKLSEEILVLPFEKQWEMIKTYINGDGNIYRRRFKDSVTYRVDTASRELAIQIQEILARGNIFAPIKKAELPSTYIEGRKLLPHTMFNISFKLDKKHKFVKENEEYFFVPIKRLENKPFEGKVYNVEVEGKHNSYLVKGFVVHNCVAAIASSEALCHLVKGKRIEEALKIGSKEIVEFLGGDVPAPKIHCSLLAQEALKKAVEDYRKK